VFVNGKAVRIRSPGQAIRLGIGLVPEDRKRQGLVLSESVLHNTSLPILKRISRVSFIRGAQERALAGEYFARMRVRTSHMDAPAAGLSGGNQQKIVLARWLAARSRILILDEPTRGVDVGAKAEIHALIDELAIRGHAILLISSELPEILGLARRILVLRAGRIVDEVARKDATQDRLLYLMAGLDGEATGALPATGLN
jgi:ABC-type sugar transport system ATPase subunit